MRATAAVTMMIFTAAAAYAQPQATPSSGASAKPKSSYCAAGSAGFQKSDAAGIAGLAKCVRGDTIIIPAGDGDVVARVCDFTKSIVTSGGYTVCVMQGEMRASK